MSETIDIVVLKNILQGLVTKPEEIKINRQIDEMGVLLSIRVNPQDMGIVIGRNGAMATAIKTVMKSVGKANNMNIRVQFLEPDGSLRFGKKNFKEERNQSVSNGDKKSETTDKTNTLNETVSLEDDLKDFVIN